MTLDTIIETYLKDHGHAGLVNLYDECGCGVKDLFPCGSPNMADCEAADRITPNDERWKNEWTLDGAKEMFVPARRKEHGNAERGEDE